MRHWFKMYDPDPKHPEKSGMHLIDPAEAPAWNAQDFGIFWTINEFRNGIRQNAALERINAWAIDIDHGDKRALILKLAKAPLLPSLVVETRNGLHVYWNAKPGADEGTYRSIVEDRLGWLYGGDPKAKDLARVLRVPGFWHCKDPANRFLVNTLFEKKVAYTQEEMVEAFRLPRIHETVVAQKYELRQTLKTQGDGFFEKLWSMDQMEALKRLSGTAAVRGESYKFVRTTKGKFNIWVNGKDSGCFIDENHRIGSTDGGGPTVANWLRWFGLDWKTTIRVLKEHFPELREEGDK